MKELKAIIQTAALEKVLLALRSIEGLPGCTVSFVRGYQRSGGSSEESLDYDERTKLEIVVKDSDANKVIEAVAKSSRTGSRGDGKIFVADCADVIGIRTRKHGRRAL